MALDNPFYTQENHGPYELYSLGDFELTDGDVISDCKLAYATFGELNAARDNAILVPTWYSGTSKIMETVYIGEDHALDPRKYFIVVINQIGNGLSSSPHNTDGPQGMNGFPHPRIEDDVRAQHQLLSDLFGIESLALVVGGSMGAQQTYEWAVRYPDMVKRAAPLAGYARNTDHDFWYTQTLMDAITSDPGFAGGNYASNADVADGLRRHARLWTVMGWSTEYFAQETWRDLGFDSAAGFVEDFMEAYFLALDPNSLLRMGWKWQRGDVSRHTDGDLAAALGRIKARTFVMPIDHDMFFATADCEREQALIPDSELRILESTGGHLALFGVEPAFVAQVDRHLSELLGS